MDETPNAKVVQVAVPPRPPEVQMTLDLLAGMSFTGPGAEIANRLRDLAHEAVLRGGGPLALVLVSTTFALAKNRIDALAIMCQAYGQIEDLDENRRRQASQIVKAPPGMILPRA